MPVPTKLSETRIFATSADPIVIVDPALTEVATNEKVLRPMYRSSLYSTNEFTEPRFSSVSLTITEATEVSVWVPDPVLVISIVDPPCVADKVSSSVAGTVFT